MRGMPAPALAILLASAAAIAAAPPASVAPKAAPAPAASALAPAVARVKWIEERAVQRDTTGLVVALIRDRSLATRAAAARALGLIQERSTTRALVTALADRSATVRREAAFALGLMGDTTTVGAIALRWEREVDPGVRETMVTAIGYLGAQAGAPTILRALDAKRESERLRPERALVPWRPPAGSDERERFLEALP